MFKAGGLWKWARRWPPVLGYPAAVLLAVAAQVARHPLDPPTLMPYITYVPFMALSAFFGGLGPGLLTTTFCVLESLYFATEPVGSFTVRDPQHFLGLGALAFTGVVTSVLFERLKQARRIDAAARELAALIDQTYDAAYAWDDLETARITFWNRGAEQLYGYSREEALDRISYDFLRTAFPAGLTACQKALRQDGYWEGELQQTAHDGRQLTVESRLAARLGEDGQLRVIAVNRDVSERKRAEQELRQAFQQRQLALEAAGLGTWDYRFDTGDLFWDERCRDMFGVPTGARIGYDQAIQCIHPQDRGGVEEAVQAAIAGAAGGAYHWELRVVWPDGSVHWVASHGQMHFEGDGAERRAVRFVGVNMDITERKRAEEQIRQLNCELEQRVHERTRQLEIAIVELEKAARAKDRFLASMSHELRTPLNAIIGFTGMLLMKLPGPLNEDQTKQLKIVQASARHQLSLISDLLDLARIGAGKVTLNPLPTVVQSVVDEVSSTLRPQAEDKKLEFKVTVPDEQQSLVTDRQCLCQILLNLTGNAIKFTEQGEVRITVVRTSYREKSWIEFSVHDTGIGIRPEDQPKLFEPFTRLAKRPSAPEGTGLGLQLSQKLAELLGGSIRCQSEFGKGSTFTLKLPAG